MPQRILRKRIKTTSFQWTPVMQVKKCTAFRIKSPAVPFVGIWKSRISTNSSNLFCSGVKWNQKHFGLLFLLNIFDLASTLLIQLVSLLSYADKKGVDCFAEFSFGFGSPKSFGHTWPRVEQTRFPRNSPQAETYHVPIVWFGGRISCVSDCVIGDEIGTYCNPIWGG